MSRMALRSRQLRQDGAGRTAYVVPLNFGYTCEDGAFTFYCHSAKEGKKLDVIRKNASVAFEMDCQNTLNSPRASGSSPPYRLK